MCAKNKQYKKPLQQAAKANAPRPQVAIKSEVTSQPYLKWILIVSVLVITFITYRYSLHNEFTNWDDGVYIETNPYVKNLTSENLKMIFTHSIQGIYFHPLTMLSLAINYHYSKMSPEPYYITNIVLHLLNTMLVFLLVLQLLQAMTKAGYGKIKWMEWFAALCALWHGIHPMHVESVSWLADRKDVLYLFFYLIGLRTYVLYAEKRTLKLMIYTTIFYILALISKPLAVTFPLSIFAIDILLKRDKETLEIIPILKPFYILTKAVIDVFRKIIPKLTEIKANAVARLIAEKAPLFVVSIIVGIITYKIADKGGSISSFQVFTIPQRLMFASDNFITYFAKAFVPIHLCSYYPYPNTDAGGALPIIFYMAPVLAILLPAVPLYIAYKGGENYFRVVLFGFLFYFFNVLFILQLVSAGPTILSERYSYAAYLSVVFMAVYFIYVLIDKFPKWRPVVLTGVTAVSIVFGYICYDRTKVWHNTKTLWEDVIAKFPLRVETSYKNLGNYYAERGQYDSAYMNYKVLADLHTTDAGVYSNIANIYGIKRQYDKALAAYSESMKLDSNNFDTYLDRAITYSMMGQYAPAFKDYDRAYSMNTKSEKLLENRAYTYLSAKQYDKSINDYTTLIQINPDKPQSYFNRGIAEFNKGADNEALSDFLRTLGGDPQNKDCMYDIALTYERLKDYPNALNYALKAKQAGFAVSDDYLAKLKSSTH